MQWIGARLRFIVFLAALVSPLAMAEKEQLGGWDSSEALALADKLSAVATRLVIECRNAPPNYSDIDAGNHLEFRYHARHFRSVAATLSNAIEDDKGYLGTAPIVNELVDISGDLKRYAVGNPRGVGKRVEDAVIAIESVLLEMSALYAESES
tara:strand:+ start:54 stop:512 length:459 start_codon:yes stop_codon:yes gene_type:complete